MIDAWSQSKGMETSMFVNAINTVFLGALTMPKLKECANKFNIKPVLIFIVSVLGYIVNGEIDNSRKSIIFDGLNDPKLARRDASSWKSASYASLQAYALSSIQASS
ncbi:hypothetical protein AWENTII_008967 [Aspergillus wentii]